MPKSPLTCRKVLTWLALGCVYLLPFITVIGASDIYLKVDVLKGEAIEDQYQDWIETQSAQFGVSRTVSFSKEGLTASPPSVSNFSVTKRADKSSPLLFKESVIGRGHTVELDYLRTADERRQRYYKVTLYDAFAASMSFSGSADEIFESVAFDCAKIEMTYTDFAKGGTGVSSTVWYDLATGKAGDSSPIPNTSPTISAINAGTGTTPEDTAITVSFTVGDAETAAGSLTLSALSSNGTVAPVSGIAFGGSGANRTATITPASNQSGSSTITIRVSDGTTMASSSFSLTVDAVNDAPTVAAISSKVTNVNTPLDVGISINDVDTSANLLNVTASSSNQSLVPDVGLGVSGTGTSRTLTITPLAGKTGTTTITVSVSDGALSASNSFLLTIQQPTPQTPTNILLSNTSIPEKSTNGTVIGTLSAVDADSATHVFTLIDSAGGRFKIQGNQLQVNTSALLDFENATTHDILVKATDPGGLEFSKTLVIQVLNVNEAPVFLVSDNSVIETITARDTGISRLQVTDPDAGTNAVTLNLRVINGVLTVHSNFAGTITSNGTPEVTLLGTLSNLNGVLTNSNGLLYRATTNATGTDILTATVNDHGHTGIGTNHIVFTTLGIHFYQSQYVQWLSEEFSESELANSALESTLWGTSADSDNDGLPNLTEYAIGSSPRLPNPKPSAQLVTKGNEKFLSLQMACRRDPDLTLSVEVAGEVVPELWSSAASDLEQFPPVDLGTGFDQLRFDDRSAQSAATRRFMRMRWTLQNAP